MNYDFDKPIDRSGSGDLKHQALLSRWGRDDLLPLWVADMDWETPPFITEALRRRLDHSLYGYTVEPPDFRPAIIDWVFSHHGWQLHERWLSFVPGIVRAIGMVVSLFSGPDDAVVIQPPVYHPFRLIVDARERKLLQNPLCEKADGGYAMDFDHLVSLVDSFNAKGPGRVRLLLLSNPHNPGGICWDRATLTRLAHICHERDIIVVSDEIHCDLTLWGHRHVPFATVCREAAEGSITFMAPTKTFNIAALMSSFAIVPDDAIRRRFFTWLGANELDEPSLFAPIATIAAYRRGEAWRRQMLRYVEGNVGFLSDFLAAHIPQIKAWKPQASFLVWLDCRGLGLDHDALLRLFVDEARLALCDGEIFFGGEAFNRTATGGAGHGFMRINVGTQRSVLCQALTQLREAVERLGL